MPIKNQKLNLLNKQNFVNKDNANGCAKNMVTKSLKKCALQKLQIIVLKKYNLIFLFKLNYLIN